jgi:hypothetical protein
MTKGFTKVKIVYRGKTYNALMKIKDIADSVERYRRSVK